MSPNIDLLERTKIIAAKINSGSDSYAGRLDAWHKLGAASGVFQTWKEMVAAAKADFKVIKLQLDLAGLPLAAWGTFRIDAEIPKGLENEPVRKFAMADGTSQYLNFLGTVGKDYNVIQHTDGFEILDNLVGQIDGAHYETMGTLDFGRTVWGQVDPNISIRVGDDVSDVLLSFHTSHDGSKAFDIYESILRHVCRNTLKAGSLKRLAATMRIRHTKNAQQRIKELHAEIAEIRSVAMTMQERLNYLSTKRVTKESLSSIMARLFPMTKNDDGIEQTSSRRDNILANILALYEDNDNNAFPEQRGTSYNLLNAITNYADHQRGTDESRSESAVFGSGDKLKSTALDLIIAESEKMPLIRSAQTGIAVDFADLGLNVPGARKN